MPLDPTRLANAMKMALLADGATQAIDNDSLSAVCAAIAQVVIAEIVANAVVLPLLLVAPPGGGPVTGTGTIT